MAILPRAAAALITLATPLSAQDSASVSLQLDGQYARFSQAYVALDPDLVADIYTEDAFYLSPGADIRRGRAVIRLEFAGFFDAVRERGDSVRITFTIVDRRISGDQAADIGYYALTTTPQSDQPRTSRGKFVVIWVRETHGVWHIRTDIYSDALRNGPP